MLSCVWGESKCFFGWVGGHDEVLFADAEAAEDTVEEVFGDDGAADGAEVVEGGAEFEGD